MLKLTPAQRDLHRKLRNILKRETGVLDPEDANGLALTIVNELPQEYQLAPELLRALEDLMEFWDNDSAVHPGSMVVHEARETLAKAKGGTP